MITLIEAHNFRCLRYISQPLRPFQILIGANGSGKTTFLAVLNFLSRLVSVGLSDTIADYTQNFSDLVWQRQDNNGFQLALEAQIPPDRRRPIGSKPDNRANIIRYEVHIGVNENQEVMILEEKVSLLFVKTVPNSPVNYPLFSDLPNSASQPVSQIENRQTVISKNDSGKANFYFENRENVNKLFPTFNFGPVKTALANLPEDEDLFPATTWLKNLLINEIQLFVLNSQLIRKASPPYRAKKFKTDGSNLPWAIDNLKKQHPERFEWWLGHIKEALPDVTDIVVVSRPEDLHCYLQVCYQSGLTVPSWLVSDGTLRFLALTLLAYLPDLQGILLIEEPENGIHPSLIELAFQSLSAVRNAQVLLATHSPVILANAELADLLCFAKTASGETSIITGDQHAQLQDWEGTPGLDVLLANGVFN